MPRKRQPARRTATATLAAALPLLSIGTAALLVRMLYLASVADAPFIHNLQTNPARYDTWAKLILNGQAPAPPFDQAPGYPYLLALIYAVAGPSASAVRGVQAAMDALTCIAIALAAMRVAAPRAGRSLALRPGIIAGLLAVAYGPFIYFTGELLPATSSLLALSGAVTAALYGRWYAAGLAFAVATGLRLETLIGLPLLVATAWRSGSRHACLAVSLPVLLVPLALCGMNLNATGRWSAPTTGSGLNLWLGNNPHADGVSPFVSGPLAPIADRARTQANADPLATDALLRVQAIDFWREFPRQAVGLAYKKLRWTLSGRELPNTSDIEWQESYSWMFRVPGLPLGLGVVLALALAALPELLPTWQGLPGPARVRRRTPPLRQATGERKRPKTTTAPAGPAEDGYASHPVLLLAIGPCIALVTGVVFFTNARFRLPMLPTLLVLAGMAVDQTWTLLPQWRRHQRRLAAMAAAAGFGVWLAYSDPYDVWSYRIAEIDVNTGSVEREAGNYTRAADYLRRALRSTPDDEIAWVHLALALEQQGDPPAAAEAYLDGLARSSGRQHLPDMARRFFARHHLNLSDLQNFLDTESPALRAATEKAVVEKLRTAQ